MIHSRPKLSALFAVAFFLALILATEIWLIVGLVSAPETHFTWKFILIPVLFVVAIIVTAKSYFRALSLKLGKDRISYQYLLSKEKSLPLTGIRSWEEQVVKRKGSTYKQLVIVFADGKKLALSNQENSDYEQVVKYLRKKIGKKG